MFNTPFRATFFKYVSFKKDSDAMKEIGSDTRGIKGLSASFKKIIGSIEPNTTIVFCGLPYSCTPIIEFLVYVIRKQPCNLFYIPYTDISKARSIHLGEYIMELGECVELKEKKIDVIVLMGGLAMPGKCKASDAQSMIKTLSNETTKVVGVCFMNMFQKAGWTDIVPFDYLENSDMLTKLFVKE